MTNFQADQTFLVEIWLFCIQIHGCWAQIYHQLNEGIFYIFVLIPDYVSTSFRARNKSLQVVIHTCKPRFFTIEPRLWENQCYRGFRQRRLHKAFEVSAGSFWKQKLLELKFGFSKALGIYLIQWSQIQNADQLRGHREADLRLCFRKCKISVFSQALRVTYNWIQYPLLRGMSMMVLRDIINTVTRTYKSKIINGRPRECHNKKVQPIPSTKRKRNLHETETTKLHVNNSRKTSSLFPNRGSWSTTAYNK